jgi:hypothetical protein
MRGLGSVSGRAPRATASGVQWAAGAAGAAPSRAAAGGAAAPDHRDGAAWP